MRYSRRYPVIQTGGGTSAETLTPVAQTWANPFEARVGLSATKILPWEARLHLATTRLISFENLKAVANATLAGDGDFETGLSYWLPNSGATVTRSTEQAKGGAYSLKVVTPGSVGEEGAAYNGIGGIVAGHRYVYSIWLYTAAPQNLRQLVYNNGWSVIASNDFTSTAGWQKLTLPFTADDSGQYKFYVVTEYGVAHAYTFYLDDFYVGQVPYTVPYDAPQGISKTAINPFENLKRVTTIQTTPQQIAGSGVNQANGGTDWTNPGTVTTDNGTYAATVTLAGDSFSDALITGSHGLSIPTGAVITGLEVEIDQTRTSQVYNVWFTKNGIDGCPTGKNDQGGNGIVTLGGSNDLWGYASVTEAEAEASGFGVMIIAGTNPGYPDTFSIDDVKINVYYYDYAPLQYENLKTLRVGNELASDLLDDFNRADNTSSLGENYGDGILTGASSLGISSNQAYASGQWRSNYWLTALQQDQEAWITLAAMPTYYVRLHTRISTPGTTTLTSYFITIDSTGAAWIEKYINGTGPTTLKAIVGSGVPVYQVGDVVGLRAVGSLLEAWRKRSGVWELLDSTTDTSITGSGYVGFLIGAETDARFDNFGGGKATPNWTSSYENLLALAKTADSPYEALKGLSSLRYIDNPGFEDGTLEASQATNADWDSWNYADIANSAANPHSGLRHIRCITDGTQANAGLIVGLNQAGIPILQGQVYKITAWVDAPLDQGMAIGIDWKDSSENWIFATSIGFDGTGDYQLVEISVVAPANAAYAHPYIRTNSGDYPAITFDVDDVTFGPTLGLYYEAAGYVTADLISPYEALIASSATKLNPYESLHGVATSAVFGDIIDNFTGADESPITTNWSGPLFGGEGQLSRIGNQLKSQNADNTWAAGWYDIKTFGPDCEGQITFAAAPVGTTLIWIRVSNQGSLPYGYTVSYNAASGTISLTLFKSGDPYINDLGSWASNWLGTGDRLGIRCIGSSIQAWKYTSGTWSLVGSAVDATHAGPGYIGIEVNYPANILDDFGATTLNPLGLSYEAVQPLSSTKILPWESMQIAVVVADYILSWEALVALSLSNINSYENLVGLSTTKESSFESLIKLAKTGEFPWEALQAEVVIADYVLAWEVLTGVRTTNITPFENIQKFAATFGIAHESLSSVAWTSFTEYESLVGIQALRGVDYENSGWATSSYVLPAEALVNVSIMESLSYESIIYLALTGALSWEAIGFYFQYLRPDADLDTDQWQVAPLYPKVSDESDSTVITNTAQ